MQDKANTIVSLRKLSMKSILGFGKHADLSVSMLMSTCDGRRYLRWCYYNLSKISFLDEILDELRITEEFRFEKPGINTDLNNKIREKFTNEYESHLQKAGSVVRKIHELSDKKRRDVLSGFPNSLNHNVQSKNQLMKKNHGKK